MENNTMDMVQVLQDVGLNKNEISVYLDLVKSGKSSVLEVSKRTGLHRSNVYSVLESLMSKGIVGMVLDQNRKLFMSTNPNNLVNYLKIKQKTLEIMLPKLPMMIEFDSEKKHIKLFEGATAIKNGAYTLNDFGEPIYVMGGMSHFERVLGEGFCSLFHSMRTKKKIPIKTVSSEKDGSISGVLNKLKFSEARYVPGEESSFTTVICGERVFFIFWNETPIQCLLIQSKFFSNSLMDYFNYLWIKAKKPTNSNSKK